MQHVVEGSEKANVSANLFQAWTDQATRLRLTVEEAEAAIEHAGKSLEPQLNPTKGNAGGDLAKHADSLSNYMGHDTQSKQAIEAAKSMDEFASGGHVSGPGTGTSDSIPAMLSSGEFVVNAGAVRGNHALLEALNSGHALRFASGGIVGAPPALSSPPSFSGVGGPHVAINSPVTVNASGGTPAQNQDLAKQFSASVEQSMRNTVVDELRKQMRSGGLMSSTYSR